MAGRGLTFWDRLALAGLCGALLVSSRPQDEVELPPEEVVATEPSPVHLRIELPPTLPAHRWASEAAGHAVLLTERRLAEVEGVVPVVERLAVRPGLSTVVVAEDAQWTLRLGLSLDGEALGLEGQLCDAVRACTAVRGEAERLAVHIAVDSLVAQVAAVLERSPPPASRAESADPYALLLLGRACAALLGLHPPATGSVIGNVRRDPMARATLIDPGMHTVWWVRARYVDDLGVRRQLLERALDTAPGDVGLLADLGATLGELGLPRQAWERWEDVGRREPEDLRYALPRVEAALAVGETSAADAVLQQLPPGQAEQPAALAARVAVAESRGGASDDLLARWQEVDRANPEPVRRRIAGLVDQGRIEEALGLTSELALRGAVQEASRLVLALASDLGRFDDAVLAAERLGDAEAAGGLRARRAGDDPAAIVRALAGATAPEARLARADALLRAGEVNQARRELDAILEASPWWADAIAVAARAADLAGDEDASSTLWTRLRRADPLYAEARR